jgi:glucokinase
MNLSDNQPVVMTLDAGGTNFVFSAVKAGKEIVRPVGLPSHAADLDLCLKNIIKGFEAIEKQLIEKPAAISFAFPGPADYLNGIIGDLGNLPGFRGGVALGPMLEEHFQMPVFINNDGDLFAYGEAMHGMLPGLNEKLRKARSAKQYRNLIGITLGTGFGGGLVRNNDLIIGDNGAAGEVWLLRNPFSDKTFAEENISARAITNEYYALNHMQSNGMAPLDVFQIAKGQKEGNRDAAIESFNKFGRALGIALAEIVTLMDAPVVIGGGLANAWELFFPAMLKEMNGNLVNGNGSSIPRLVMQTFNLEESSSFEKFAKGEMTRIKVPFSEKEIIYDPQKRIGVGISHLGASKAISLGAYAFAVHAIDNKDC